MALVTGASSGIGAATARSLADAGAAVAVWRDGEDRLEGLASAIRADGGQRWSWSADITADVEAAAAVARMVDALGRLDTVVNNAGLMLLGPVADASVDEWDRMLAINVQAVLAMTHAAFPTCCRPPRNPPGGSPTW